MCIYNCSIWWLVIGPLRAMHHPACRWTDSEPGLDGSKPWPVPPCAAASMLNMVCWVYIIWVCLKIVYLIFQWIITMFPIKIAICGYPLFSDKPTSFLVSSLFSHGFSSSSSHPLCSRCAPDWCANGTVGNPVESPRNAAESGSCHVWLPGTPPITMI